MSNQSALFPEPIDGVKGRFWLTPPDLMARLNSEFHFDFDACPYPRPAGLDSLREQWGKRTFVNPPIEKGSSLSAWVNKGVEEAKLGNTSVMLLPFQRWFRKLLEVDVEFRFGGPIYFLSPNGTRAKSEGGGKIPDIITVLRPKTREPAPTEAGATKA